MNPNNLTNEFYTGFAKTSSGVLALSDKVLGRGARSAVKNYVGRGLTRKSRTGLKRNVLNTLKEKAGKLQPSV